MIIKLFNLFLFRFSAVNPVYFVAVKFPKRVEFFVLVDFNGVTFNKLGLIWSSMVSNKVKSDLRQQIHCPTEFSDNRMNQIIYILYLAMSIPYMLCPYRIII